MKKKNLTGILLGCLAFVPPAFSQDNRTTGPDIPALQTEAEQGDAAAQKKLGDYYFSKCDKENGLKWVRKSAEAGNAEAQSSLGYRYEKGSGVTEDAAEARKWYRMAAEQGHGTAQYNLCKSFANSLTVN